MEGRRYQTAAGTEVRAARPGVGEDQAGRDPPGVEVHGIGHVNTAADSRRGPMYSTMLREVWTAVAPRPRSWTVT